MQHDRQERARLVRVTVEFELFGTTDHVTKSVDRLRELLEVELARRVELTEVAYDDDGDTTEHSVPGSTAGAVDTADGALSSAAVDQVQRDGDPDDELTSD